MKTCLNFGCGKDIRQSTKDEKWINIDIVELPGTDVVHDFDKFPYPFENNTFDYVFSCSVVEHLNDIPKVIKELHRICKPNAVVFIRVPYYNSKGAYNDVTHKHFFSSTAFEPFYMHNHKSEYGINTFELIDLNLVPTRLGKLIFPEKVRILASTVLGEVIRSIEIKLKVKKGPELNKRGEGNGNKYKTSKSDR